MLTTVLMCQQGIPFRVSPARIQMIDELVQRGSKVIIFFPGSVSDSKIRNMTEEIINTKEMHIAMIRKKIRKINPNIIICFTEEDTRICFPLPYIMHDTDFYYYNLEIYVCSRKKKNSNFFYKMINSIDYLINKTKEMLYVRGCCSIVIQDPLRKKILKKYWISHPTTWFIPNSYYSNFNKVNVPHKRGLIYSGSVGNDVLGSFIKHAAELKDVEITIAGWYRANIKLKDNSNIKVIRHILSQEEYTKFISAYDIALIWYSDKQDDNVYNIGLASGKFFKHLSLGQPVIVNDVPGLAKEVRKYNLGVVINDLSELGDAVSMINNNYDLYVDNVRQTYEKKYDYKKVSQLFFDSVISNAKKIEGKHKNC